MNASSNGLMQQSWTWFSQALTQHDTFQGYFQPLIQMLAPQWSTDSYRAQIVDIRDEMDDMVTLVLKPKTGLIDRDWPTFQAGQFIELMVEKEGTRTLRCFSISSSPAYYEKTGLIELSIRIQAQGRITPWIRQQLKIGSLVNISAAQGQFVLPQARADDQNSEKYLFIAGGSGITPFRSMLQQISSITSNSREQSADIQLLYYSRNNQHVLFQQEFEQLAQEHSKLNIAFIDGEESGFICTEHVQAYCSDYYLRTAFICGPSPMIQQARKVLSELEVAQDKIVFEFFGAVPVEIESNEQGAVVFQTSDKTVISEEGSVSTLLEQAENAGISPVSGCRIGVCHQCICKKKSGIVFNTRTQQYSDTGSEEIQLCISVAQGDVVLDL
jgi:ferredoxin-NADP reductase